MLLLGFLKIESLFRLQLLWLQFLVVIYLNDPRDPF